MEQEIENELERLGLNPVDRGRYWLIHCPTHQDRNKSAQCFKDGWIHCHAGCQRRHINSLANRTICPREYDGDNRQPTLQTGDFTEIWMGLDPVKEDIKGVPAAVLRKVGWKEYPGGDGYAPGVFIPYFNVSRTKVLFFQIRHGDGSPRRFSFCRGIQPICYGMEVLQRTPRYLAVTEGSRDSVILRYAGVPAIALPSASSGRLAERLSGYCREHRIILVWAGDNDDAGKRLQSNINIPYIDARPSIGKDVGELFAAKGIEGVKQEYGKYKFRENSVQQNNSDAETTQSTLIGAD